MSSLPLILCDQRRLEQFHLLGRCCRPFEGYTTWTDGEGIPWAGKRVNGHCLAVTWLGPGWVFDDYARTQYGEAFAKRRQAIEQADDARHQAELAAAVNRVRLGRLAERLLWAVHQAVRTEQSSVVRLPDGLLRHYLWGPDRYDKHWRQVLLSILDGLAWLHLAAWPGDEPPPLGTDTILLTHVGDLRGTGDDRCDARCPCRHGPRHSHLLVNIGRGFLGVLEQLAVDSGTKGTRSYAFPTSPAMKGQQSLRQVGKGGQLVQVYLPACLGDAMACEQLSDQQHRLLQAVLRETTRRKRERRTELSAPEIVAGN